MKTSSIAAVLPWLAALLAGPLCKAAVINVTPGFNNVTIQQVVYTINNVDVIQNTDAGTAVTSVGNGEVNVKSFRVFDGGVVNLEYINTAGATVLNVNPELQTISGIGVFDNGLTTTSNGGGLSAFATAVAATTTNADLRNFVYYDYLSSPPTSGVPDYDLLYVRAMKPDDFVMVSERFGNTYFEITPLDAAGNPIAGANKLRFGGLGGGPYAVYDWNSGFAAAGNQPSQAQAFSIASVSKFFEGTGVTPTAVFGFRIDNDGEADTKFLVVGSNSFDDNPLNPVLVPEPSSLLMALGAGVVFVMRRKRLPVH
jgi:hypothetical protein